MKQLTVLFLVFFLASCSGKSDHSMSANEAYTQKQEEMGIETEESLQKAQFTSQEMPQKKKIIKMAQLTFEVKDFEKASIAIKDLCGNLEAEITNETESNYSHRIDQQMTIRISPLQFDTLIMELEKIAWHIDNKNIHSDDVTKQFVDLETRLASKEAIIKRYTELLAQAKNVNDILQVEEHLRKVTEEIESVKGQLKYLNNQVNQSTVNINYYQQVEGQSISKRSFGSRIIQSFSNGWSLLKELFLGVITIWPILLVIGVVTYFVAKRRKLNKKH